MKRENIRHLHFVYFYVSVLTSPGTSNKLFVIVILLNQRRYKLHCNYRGIRTLTYIVLFKTKNNTNEILVVKILLRY